ncbi:MAG: hypothetical protein ABIG63_17495 [Chloroflexota bacterium]
MLIHHCVVKLALDTSCAKYGKNDPDMTVNLLGDYIICEGFEAKS